MMISLLMVLAAGARAASLESVTAALNDTDGNVCCYGERQSGSC